MASSAVNTTADATVDQGAAAAAAAGDSGSASAESGAEKGTNDVRILEENLAELRNSVRMLEESNTALAEALLEGPDEDYTQALEENKQVLLRKRQMIDRIETVIAQSRELAQQMNEEMPKEE